jgi:hypothetical protein
MTTKTNYTDSFRGVRSAYVDILDYANAMEKIEDNEVYYKMQEELNEKLRAFLKLRFIYLETRELLTIISLVSTHRPVQPHSFLITCATLIK